MITALSPGETTIMATSDNGIVATHTFQVTALPGEPAITRLGGADRYATAVEIAKKGWPTGASTVVLAVGTNYPDALAATPLAAIKDAPILLTTTAATPKVTLDEIKTLNPTNIILLGSTTAISAAQETTFKNSGYSVTRYGGANRYETAQIIGNVVEALGGSKTAVLVTGLNYPDALSMGSIAAMNKMPIIFSTATDLPGETKTFISANKITNIVSVGYTATNATIVSQTKSAVGASNITYITGPDRYATSLAIVNHYKSGFADGVTVATGANFPDALTGGPLAAKLKFPVLLVNPATGASAGTKNYVKGLSSPDIYVYGSTATPTDAIVQGLY
jgi:putative cell wall-binding protein